MLEGPIRRRVVPSEVRPTGWCIETQTWLPRSAWHHTTSETCLYQLLAGTLPHRVIEFEFPVDVPMGIVRLPA